MRQPHPSTLDLLVAWASRKVGRPVKWTCERSEALATDYQGRDLTVEAELALDRDGEGRYVIKAGSPDSR